MTSMLLLRPFLAIVLGVVLAACGSVSGVGPVHTSLTPEMQDEHGIGGTGFQRVPGGDEGVGGTGYRQPASRSQSGDEGVGGTGIVGVVTSLGDLIVSGLPIDYSTETPVTIDGDRATTADLAIGQLVAIESRRMGERYQARLMDIQHAVVGPVASVDAQARVLSVLGQNVHVRETDALPAVGDWIRVSGVRNSEGTVTASRIELVAPGSTMMVRGVATKRHEGGVALGGLAVAPNKDLTYTSYGDELVLHGHLERDVFQAHTTDVASRLPFGGRVDDVIMDGYIVRDDDGTSRLAGRSWVLSGQIEAVDAGTLQRMTGRLASSSIFVDQSLDLMSNTSGTPLIQLRD